MSDHARIERFIDQGRFAEARDALAIALAADPEDVGALVMLAVCCYHDDTDDPAIVERGLDAVRRALHLEPEMARAHAVKALLLSEKKAFNEAHEAVDTAIALDPEASQFHGAKAQVYLREQKWAPAEEAARQGLALDAEDNQCSAALSHSLLMQGKADDLKGEIAYRLQRNPEDPYTHYNMGLAALRSGDRKKAEEHLREALRLDPSFEPARSALLEAFRSRSPFYRAHLWLQFRLASLPPNARIGVAIGLYVVYRIAVGATKESSPKVMTVIILAYLCFALSSFLMRGFGNFIILLDKAARLALRNRERWEGVIVGGGAVVGLIGLAYYFVTGSDVAAAVGFAGLGSAIPSSIYFRCDRPAGRRLYGVLSIVTAVGALALVLDSMISPGEPGPLSFLVAPAAIACIASTWLAMFGVKVD